METALLKLQLDDQAATAAGAALEGLGVCTAFGCPCYMRVAHCHFERRSVSDLPCNIRREGGKSLVIGGSSLVILEGKACNPL